MCVVDVMQAKVVTVSPDTTVPAAERLMREHGVHHLPVLEGEAVVGMVSAHDLARVLPSPATSLAKYEVTALLHRLTVEEIMRAPVIVVEPSRPLDEALHLMVVEELSVLPVTEAGRLVGILTAADVLALFVTFMRAPEPSSRLDVAWRDNDGVVSDVVCALARVGAPVANLVTFRTPDGRRRAVVHIATIDPRPAIAALKASGYDVDEPCRDAEHTVAARTCIRATSGLAVARAGINGDVSHA